MTYSALNKAALEAEHSGRIYFLFLDFTGDPFWACTGNRTYTFGGNSYLGIGEIAGIEGLAGSVDVAARQVTLTLSGVDASITQPILSRTNYKGRSAQVYRGLLDSNYDLVDDPELRWSGRMDVGSVSRGDTYTAQMVCEPLAARLLRPNTSRFSDEDHQTRHSGDLFYQLMPQMEKKDVIWGGQRVAPTPGGGGRGGPGDGHGGGDRPPNLFN